jgi:ligand-binding sensor domain-containing protein
MPERVNPKALILACLALLAVGSAATSSYAQLAWEPAGPVSTSAGMTAVATDPDDPKVIWLGSASSVWVSEDDGQTFHLALQLSRASGLVRETGSQPIDPSDEEEVQQQLEEELGELTQDELEDLPQLQIDTEGDAGGRSGEDEGFNEDGEFVEDRTGVVERFGVVRIRVIGDKVYVCTSRGLFTLARTARRVGTGRELRFGRRIAVNDVAVSPDGQLWVATDAGLYNVGTDGIGRTARGLEEDLAVRTVVLAEGRLVLATSRGLRFGSRTFDGFDRFSLGGRDTGLEDILVEPEGRVLVSGADQVARLLARPGETTLVEDIQQVPGASRLALGRDGTRWAVGRLGAWRWHPDEGWQRRSEGLFDRRLVDVAPGLGGTAHLWVVGRSGAWRLVTEAARVYASAAARLAETALEGWPTDDEVLRWATDARGVRLDDVDAWALEERLSWLVPKVELRFTWNRLRNEDYLFIPVLDRRLLDRVDVRPKDDNWLVLARWDVMPALLVALDGSRSIFETTRARARRQLERVREVVLPLYQTWARKKIDEVTTEPKDVRDAVRDILLRQRLEADLHVYTKGRFPAVAPTKGSKQTR